MSNMEESLYNIRLVDEIGQKETVIHKLHPISKVITTLVFLITTISFDKYDVGGLFPLVIYPIVIIILGDLPIKPVFKRVLMAMPLILGLCIFNPLIDRHIIFRFSFLEISGGWISLISVMFKSILTVIAATILIMSTGIMGIAYALRTLKIPKIFVMQFLLTYRYITVLIEEVLCVVRAYALRSPYENGINIKVWGSLTGQLLMRTFERAQRIYIAMCCRGFQGEFHDSSNEEIKLVDIIYTFGWSLLFIAIKYFKISLILGLIITGGIK